MAGTNWSLKSKPRAWQSTALERWLEHNKGVVSVVTGGGKTMFAFLCMDVFAREHPDGRFIILVPTITLLDQWYVSLQEDFGVVQKDIACFSSEEKPEKPAVINLLVINSGRSLVKKISAGVPCFLIVDECHRAGSPEFDGGILDMREKLPHPCASLIALPIFITSGRRCTDSLPKGKGWGASGELTS